MTAYSSIMDVVTFRRLGKRGVRRLLDALDIAAVVAIVVVFVGLYVDDHDAVTWGVFAEFVVHALHVRATKREEHITDLEVAKLGKEAAEANERAALANKKLASRVVSPEGAKAFHDKLLPFKGQPVQIVVFNPAASPEIDWFAKNLWGTLNLGPVWNAVLYPESEKPELRRPVSGIHIEVAHETDVLPAAYALRDCLNDDGIDAVVTPWLRGDEFAPLLRSGPSDGEPLTRTDLIRVCVYAKY